ncbi:MAG TPA: molybdenum cofactor biosynthesis protein MoaE, partial [Acidobacteriota bacterium]|nr:molybdenum cofactor biosynthesis protein MoaE [Acidobacteriota bacterium]
MVRLVREPIDVQALRASLLRPEDGAVVTFEGTVRDHARGRKVRYLEYHAYESMALRKLEEIGERARREYAIRDIAI